MPFFPRFLLTCFGLSLVNLNDTENEYQSVDDNSSGFKKLHQDLEVNDPLEDANTHALGTMLPDDEEELLAGIADDLDLSGLPASLEDLEDYDDLFDSGGGMELEIDPQESLTMGISKLGFSDSTIGNGLPHYSFPNGVGTVAGEHPYGEHPSRTLFVRNINSNVEDSELKALFEVSLELGELNLILMYTERCLLLSMLILWTSFGLIVLYI